MQRASRQGDDPGCAGKAKTQAPTRLSPAVEGIKQVSPFGRADALAVGQKRRPHAAGAVIDRKAVAHAGKLALAELAELGEVARVEGLELVMEEDGELAEALRPALDARCGIALDDGVEVLGEVEQHRGVHRLAGQTGAAPARDDRSAVAPAHLDGGHDVVLAAHRQVEQ